MRILTWNSCGRLPKNIRLLLESAPDIAIIQECFPTHHESVPSIFERHFVTSHSDKGVAILCRRDKGIRIEREDNSEVHSTACAFRISGALNFRLVSIWPSFRKGSTSKYLEAIHNAFSLHPEWLTGSTALAGDWNCHQRWDRKSKEPRFKTMLKDFESRGIRSAYHTTLGEAHGAESTHTHHHARSKNNYHIDYIFLSEDLMRRKTHFEIGPIKHSDHAPLILDLDRESSEP